MANKDHLTSLNQRIQTEIPLAQAAGIQLGVDEHDALTAYAPFSANSNPHGTAFGGSLYVAALVAGYAQTVQLVGEADLDATVVIRQAQADYRRPFHDNIIARADPIGCKARRRFIKSVQRRGRGRIELTITIADDKSPAFVLNARFAAIAANKGHAVTSEPA